VDAGAASVTAGAWLKKRLPDFPVPTRVTRQVIGWFEPRNGEAFARERFPVFILETPEGAHYYGFPRDETGVKVGKHYHFDEEVDPDTYDRNVSATDEALIRKGLAAHLPDANGPLVFAK